VYLANSRRNEHRTPKGQDAKAIAGGTGKHQMESGSQHVSWWSNLGVNNPLESDPHLGFGCFHILGRTQRNEAKISAYAKIGAGLPLFRLLKNVNPHGKPGKRFLGPLHKFIPPGRTGSAMNSAIGDPGRLISEESF
jgi:hypothetical protein